MANQPKNKCAFCQYSIGSGCMVTPNSYYCKNAIDEYYQYLQSKKSTKFVQKSFRPWDRKR